MGNDPKTNSKSKRRSKNKTKSNLASTDSPAHPNVYQYQVPAQAVPVQYAAPQPGQIATVPLPPTVSQPQAQPVVAMPGTQPMVQQTGSHMVSSDTGIPKPEDSYPQVIGAPLAPRLLSVTRANLTAPAEHENHDCTPVRNLMSCGTYVTAIANTTSPHKYHTALAMQDTGSGLGFVTLDLVRRLNLPRVGQWSGTIQTLDGNSTGTYSVFQLFLRDAHDMHQELLLLGVPWIGTKRAIPFQSFNAMCKSFGLDPSLTQNLEGCYDLLIGVDNCRLLADRIRGLQSPEYPDAVVYSSVLSPLYFIVGATGGSIADPKTRTCSYKCEQRVLATNYYLPQHYMKSQAAQMFLDQYS